MTMTSVVLELASRRKRWWAVFLVHTESPIQLVPWIQQLWTVGDVIPVWPMTSKFSDPGFGPERRCTHCASLMGESSSGVSLWVSHERLQLASPLQALWITAQVAVWADYRPAQPLTYEPYTRFKVRPEPPLTFQSVESGAMMWMLFRR